MINNPKIFAMYLPQFHCIPENDEFWGKGFTDWVTVKNAKPLYEGHYQPRVPLNSNYYDLSIAENVKWQAELAKSHGVSGFGVYHYWFNNEKNLLTKPAEIMRDTPNLGVKYFYVWDNCLWKRSWSNLQEGNDWAPVTDDNLSKKSGPEVLIPYILGGKADWENHYNYLRSHFLSENYEKKDNMPLFGIFHFSEDIVEMCEYWNELAKADGFDGIYFIIKSSDYKVYPSMFCRYNYEPHHSAWEPKLFMKIVNKLLRILHISIPSHNGIMFYDYDKVWKSLLKYASNHKEANLIHGAFVGYDDSPRRGSNKSKIVINQTPEKFSKYLKQLIEISRKQDKNYIFLTAWNEWGEGAYLEPDTVDGLSYLEAVKKAVICVR